MCVCVCVCELYCNSLEEDRCEKHKKREEREKMRGGDQMKKRGRV